MRGSSGGNEKVCVVESKGSPKGLVKAGKPNKIKKKNEGEEAGN